MTCAGDTCQLAAALSTNKPSCCNHANGGGLASAATSSQPIASGINCIPLWLLSPPLHWSVKLCHLPRWLVSLQDFSSYRVVADLGGGYGRLLMDIMDAYSGQPPPLSYAYTSCPG